MKSIKCPKGFSFYARHVGIKRKRKDLGVIISDQVCDATAMFTKNQFCGESVTVGKEVIADKKLQGIVVTSGIANVATGAQGCENARTIMNKIGSIFSIDPKNVLHSSTGVIGPQLPMEKILSGLNSIAPESPDKVEDFASAIKTTDTKLKIRTANVGEAKILGIAKGSGMIEPNMATMLVYILTDAVIESEEIYNVLKVSVDKSFNSISIDTDTSTSDTVVLMSSHHHEVNVDDFQEALDKVCLDLALDIVGDAEGATKIITVKVAGCEKAEDAKTIAKTIVNSPLVKTAVYGADPNWGRIIMAIGKVDGVKIFKEKIMIGFGDITVFENGKALLSESDLEYVSKYIKENDNVEIKVKIGEGPFSSSVYGCDLTEDYVKINSMYST
ncbi:bifunctional glutamate N-acetyltransferase/amino-acid acetyltransferase ArgJ [Streptococcus orisasini]